MPTMETRKRRILYQFPISHFCEKIRWVLDAKGLAYETKNLAPALHRRFLRPLGGKTLPAMHDGDTFLPDSREIALYLERVYPSPSLLPPDEAERARAIALADYFDAIGADVRLYAYSYILEDGAAFDRVFFKGYGALTRLLGRIANKRIRGRIKTMYRINPESQAQALAKVLEGAERLEREIGGDPTRYLVGDALSLADITAASLFAPLVRPAGSPYDANGEGAKVLSELSGALRERPIGKWVLERYSKDRRGAAQQRAGAARAGGTQAEV